MGRRSPSPAWKTFDASVKSVHTAASFAICCTPSSRDHRRPAITNLLADKIDEVARRSTRLLAIFASVMCSGRLSRVDDLPVHSRQAD